MCSVVGLLSYPEDYEEFKKAFEKTKMRDQLKKKLCKKNKIKLIYYTSEEYKKYANYDKRNTVTSVNDLLSLIMSA